MAQFCILHPHQHLTLYCDTCKDVVCVICKQIGPHADIRHQIMTIEQAVEIRQRFYYTFRDVQIFPMREKACLKMNQLLKEEGSCLNERKVVQKDLSLQFQGMNNRIMERINHEIVKKQTEIKVSQEFINKIDDLAYSFQSVIQFPQRFLLCYQTFNHELKYLEASNLQNSSTSINMDKEFYQSTFSKNISKTNNMNAETNSVELPRQFSLILAKTNQLPLYKDKNEVLKILVEKSIHYSRNSIVEANDKIIATKKQTLDLFNKQNSQLLDFHTAYVCAYCLTPFSMEENNESCNFNKNFKAQGSYKDVDIPVQLKGNKSHYWVKARKAERPIPSIKTHHIIRSLHKKQFHSSLQDIRRIKSQLQKYDIQKGDKDAYLNQFRKDDPSEKGKVSPLAFLYILTNKFDIDETQAEVLSELLLIKEQNLVNYLKIAHILQNPFQLYSSFLVEQQELQKSKSIAPPSFRYKY